MDERESMFKEWMELIKNSSYAKLKEELEDNNPADIADFFKEIPKEKQLLIFRLLTKDNAADTFSFMDSDTQERIIADITDNEIRNIVNDLNLDDTVDFLSELPANLVTKVLKNTDSDKRKIINEFLHYPEDSAGSIMTIEFVQFHSYITVKEAMKQVRKTGLNKETIYSCYVVDERRILIGMVSLRSLVLADENTTVEELMEYDVIYVNTLDDQEDVAHIFKKYNFIALPVVDNENRLVGIITIDDIMDVIEQENTEDMEKMAALIPADEEYLKTSVMDLAKNRIVWLLVLMISGTLSGAIISSYNSRLDPSLTIMLASFYPILMGTGGNAGAQASTLIIRGMATGEIGARDVFKVILKEIRVGIIAGSTLGIVNFLRILLIKGAPMSINLVVSLSMTLTVIFAKSVGCTLPMFAKKLNFDPALMASPLISTIIDSLALIVLFTSAQIMIV